MLRARVTAAWLVALAAPLASAQEPLARPAATSGAPHARLDAIIAACEAVEAGQTVQALLREREFVSWAVRVRLGLDRSRVEWDECVLDVTTRALRSCVSLARDELVAQLFEAPDPLPFAPAMALLSELGDERDLALLVDWSNAIAQFDPSDECSSNAAGALRAGCARLAARSCADARSWTKELARASEPLRVAIVRGLADCGAPDALARLSEQLGQGRVDARIVLAELARAARREDRMHDEAVRRSVRAHLDARSELHREAALCAGALGDEQAVDALTALLADPSSGVRANAQWSLERITARRSLSSAASWARWLDGERQWWREQAPQLLSELGGSAPRGRVAAAGALVTHRFPRHSLARELASALPLNDRGAAAIVLAGLRELGSANALEPLERARELTGDRDVRAQIDATLAALRSAGAPPLR